MTGVNRRRVLRSLALGGGSLATVPGLLTGCASLPDIPAADEPLPTDPFADWFDVDDTVLARALRVFAAAGADFGEAFLQHRRQQVLELEAGTVTLATSDLVHGASLRAVRGDSVRFASTEDVTSAGLLKAASHDDVPTVETASDVQLTLNVQPIGAAYPLTTAWSDVADLARRRVLERVDRLARAADPSVIDVRVSWLDVDERIVIATLDGQSMRDSRPMTRLGLQVTMRRGDVEHSGFASVAARAGLDWYTGTRLNGLVAEAVQRTSILFEARRPPVGSMPVLFAAGSAGVVLHEAIGHTFEADMVEEGMSPYQGSLNSAIADSSITLVDDATLSAARGSPQL